MLQWHEFPKAFFSFMNPCHSWQSFESCKGIDQMLPFCFMNPLLQLGCKGKNRVFQISSFIVFHGGKLRRKLILELFLWLYEVKPFAFSKLHCILLILHRGRTRQGKFSLACITGKQHFLEDPVFVNSITFVGLFAFFLS